VQHLGRAIRTISRQSLTSISEYCGGTNRNPAANSGSQSLLT
jgi:hypothetical protein